MRLGEQAIERDAEILATLLPRFVPLTTPLTSASWDGDAYSTTASTLLDLSAVFGVPAGVRAILADVVINDSGSAGAANLHFSLDSTTGATIAAHAVFCGGLANDAITGGQGIVPCNSDGDCWYRIVASGASTMDVRIRIFGYWQ